MIDSILSDIAGFAVATKVAFLMPGELLLAGIAAIAPRTAETLTAAEGGAVVKFVLSLISWTIAVIIGLLISRFVRRVATQLVALFHTFIWRLKQYLGHLKTRLIWKFREYFPYKAAAAQHVGQTDFDETDIAVLLRVAARGPGAASSARELAKSLQLRPAQVRKVLDSLQHFRMLQPVTGSTGFSKNYRLTKSGQTYIEMIKRQARVQPRVNPAY